MNSEMLYQISGTVPSETESNRGKAVNEFISSGKKRPYEQVKYLLLEYEVHIAQY